jgi:hypothetical protein
MTPDRRLKPSTRSPGRNWPRFVAGVVTLAVWVPATLFFAVIAVSVATELVGSRTRVAAPIAEAHGAMVTVAYSLGGAVVGLGLAWLALPPAFARGLRWAAGLWLGVTALLLVTRQVGGWPLLVAAFAALGIGFDVIRRVVRGLLAARARQTE